MTDADPDPDGAARPAGDPAPAPSPHRGWSRLATTLIGAGAGDGLRFWEILSIFGFSMGLALMGVYARSTREGLGTFGILALLGSAAWLAGGVLGFLFGVPRLRTSTTQTPPVVGAGSFVPNTNLEQISDWLTKAIVGATLVQLGPIAASVNSLAAGVGEQIGAPGAATVAGAVMTMDFAGGFMWGYLWCSLRIFREMSALTDREQAVQIRERAVGGL